MRQAIFIEIDGQGVRRISTRIRNEREQKETADLVKLIAPDVAQLNNTIRRAILPLKPPKP